MKKIHALVLLFITATFGNYAQEQQLKVFLNCNCDTNYIRQNTPFLEFVRDQNLADVEIFAYNIRNAAGSQSYDFKYDGNNFCEGLSNSISFEGNPNYTTDEFRKELLKKFQLGLVPFLIQRGYDVSVSVSTQNQETQVVDDTWKNWVFELSGGLFANQEASRKVNSYNFNIEADKVTDDWRISFDFRHDNSKSTFVSDETAYNSIRNNTRIFGRVVRSLSDHFSAGLFYGGRKDTFQNLDFNYYVQPAVEYSIFPYQEVLNRELTFSYRLGAIYNDYIETTIYGYEQQRLTNHSLNFNVRFRQKWGDISSYLSATQYLNDGTKKRLSIRSNFNVRIIEGLAVRFSSNLELIRDLFSLPAGDNSIEDLLLQQRQIATDFRTSFSVGLSYTFGSIYNSIINTRL